MATEPLPIAVDPAVRRPLGDIAAGAERFTQARVERIIRTVVALGCAVLGTQAFLNALGSHQEAPAAHLPLLLVVFIPLGVMIAASVAGVGVRTAAGVFAVVFPIALLCWPLVTHGRVDAAEGSPWIWYLLNVGTTAAVLAFGLPLQIAWAAVIPILYAIARLTQLDGAPADVVDVVRDAVFAAILAAVVITLGRLLRGVAVGIDQARSEAVASYAVAAAHNAAETERVAVAALMHDSVLAALIAAERAHTEREEALATAMAREALMRLANTDQDSGEGPDEPVAVTAIAAALRRVVADLDADAPVAADIAAAAPLVPGRVARAVVLAATQAVSNAIVHAHGEGLRVALRADGQRLRVQVTDRGPGFDPASIPDDRLGIRGSIVARMAAVGGRARVRTAADGTHVVLDWEFSR
ncbi:signal transduction histidine kinase [Microbacterium laevaniformans]|uniref:sensor histidine kinase n=1 Tax=Microbacterium laevaniformans TaxID=36807 RepID=UPI001957E165|nr:ATP-binding protein [Microbacterium laevaniformans]MBM7751763.1 signal transduction histidine kinase [Microbacterium laevaniformans]